MADDKKVKRRRRRSRFGTITKRGPEQYQAYYRYEGRTHSLGIFASDQLAGDALAEAQTSIVKGTRVDPQAGRVPFGRYGADWLAHHPNLRHTTRAKYKGLLDLHLVPAFGNKALAAIKAADVRAWYAALPAKIVADEARRVSVIEAARRKAGDDTPVMARKFTGHATRADAYRLLATIYNTAIADDIIARSPCRIDGGGDDPAPERTIATVAELSIAVAALEPYQRPAVLCAGWLTLRRGEILGLRRSNVDLDAGQVTISSSWSEGEGFTEGPTKSSETRVTYIPPNILDALAEHLRDHVGPEADALLFPGKDGRPITGRTLDRWWRRARDAAGRPDLTLHDLRHSGLTWAAATGASTVALMRQAGHSSPIAALRYQHATDDQARAVAAALGTLAEQSRVVPIGAAKPKRSRRDRDGAA